MQRGFSIFIRPQYDVGVDNNDFKPVSFEEVKSIIDRQVKQQKQTER